jgi:hypothetical protein
MAAAASPRFPMTTERRSSDAGSHLSPVVLMSPDLRLPSGAQNAGSEIGYPFPGFTLPLSLQRFFGRKPAKLLGNEICDFSSTGIPPFVKADSQSQDNRSTLSLTQGAQQVGVAISDRGSPLSVITIEVSRFSGRASERITVGHGVLRSFCVGSAAALMAGLSADDCADPVNGVLRDQCATLRLEPARFGSARSWVARCRGMGLSGRQRVVRKVSAKPGSTDRPGS